MAVQGLATTDAVIVAFDDHLRRARGIGSSARQSYSRFAREFVEVVLGDGPVDLTRLGVPDVVGYVTEATAHYRPSTVQLLTTALRSFLRVVRSEGLREDRLEEAVPMVSRRRSASLPRHLGAADFARLIASLDSSSPPGPSGPGDPALRRTAGPAGERGRVPGTRRPRLACSDG